MNYFAGVDQAVPMKPDSISEACTGANSIPRTAATMAVFNADVIVKAPPLTTRFGIVRNSPAVLWK